MGGGCSNGMGRAQPIRLNSHASDHPSDDSRSDTTHAPRRSSSMATEKDAGKPVDRSRATRSHRSVTQAIVPRRTRSGGRPASSCYPRLPGGGTWVSHVRPDSGETWVKPMPDGGLGMRMRWLQPGHWIWRPANRGSHFKGWSQCEQKNLNSALSMGSSKPSPRQDATLDLSVQTQERGWERVRSLRQDGRRRCTREQASA